MSVRRTITRKQMRAIWWAQHGEIVKLVAGIIASGIGWTLAGWLVWKYGSPLVQLLFGLLVALGFIATKINSKGGKR